MNHILCVRLSGQRAALKSLSTPRGLFSSAARANLRMKILRATQAATRASSRDTCASYPGQSQIRLPEEKFIHRCAITYDV
jgi:hypothetical protein